MVAPGAGGDDSKKGDIEKGIPGFWHTVFRNADMISEMMMAVDESVILCLQDIKVILHVSFLFRMQSSHSCVEVK